ncbi:2Fe-2S iron-sulfur cluster binding domain-containing protein [Pusillimonas sp. TS35]|nr:2Fe-2S iron-sulfur cluster binding domain-containing protein [Pusillimonas sp. TS35]
MLTLCVRSITYEAEGIRSFELVDPTGGELPVFEAGAHVDVHVPGGYTRQYSLCDPAWQRRHYRIAVLEDVKGRGGSRALHSAVRAGDLVEVSEPRNLFPRSKAARRSLLLAGGIGITPVLAMAHELLREDAAFELHYCTQTPARTAFRTQLEAMAELRKVVFHHDYGDPAKGLDIPALLAGYEEGTHLYFCGPPGFMRAVKEAASHWPADAVHFEYFSAPAPTAATATPGEAGHTEVRLARSDKVLQVAGGQSILEALRDAGVPCESSCEAGVCGCCKVRYLDGAPEHNDYVLSDDEKNEYVLVCCAGVGSRELVLDL